MSAGDERASVEQRARSRAAPARRVERARIVALSRQGRRVAEIAGTLGVCRDTVRRRTHRFDRLGVAGLQDAGRSGRPPTSTPEQVGEVVAAGLTDPATLGLPFAAWTLDRLAAYLNEQRGIPVKRSSRAGGILQAEGLRWRTQETRFGERPDPAFAERRGPSSRSTRRLRRVM